ncbi:sugar phosphate nucleotidyltransferase [Acidobacteriota bacterium]
MTVRGFKTAMVLAAGLGQRMQPLTSVLPKPALPMPDGPVVASALRLAASAGATRIVVNVSHLAEHMAEAVSEVSIGGVEIALSFEAELMGSAGGLAVARDRGLLGNEDPVLVINGDGALGLDLEGFAENHFARGDLVTLALLPHLDPERWSRVVLDIDERVTDIHPPGQPDPAEVPFLYPGVMAVHREALDALPATPGEIPVNLWGPAQKERRLGGVVMAGHWREVGTPADYLEVVLLRLAGTTWIDASARVSSGASIRSSFVGRGTVVSDRAVIEESVVAEGALVGNGARITRSVLLGAVEIAPKENVVGEIRATPP